MFVVVFVSYCYCNYQCVNSLSPTFTQKSMCARRDTYPQLALVTKVRLHSHTRHEIKLSRLPITDRYD